mgnify:CR=1 FL=1|tara:strand:- start:66 stop:1499 length:1434 start_codon:yes stop_codon:yes gene_type:complete
MTLNPFFLNGTKTEQGLVQSLINEQIKMYGIECYYLPRKYMTTNTVIKEVIESKFDSAYPLEAYLDSYEGFGGQGTILSRFGIDDKDDCTLIISRERFETYIAPLSENLPNTELTTRPKEGDLIYFPLGDRIFEIKFVEHEQPFYQLKKNYVYTLTCELFRYEDEVVDTGIGEIDDNLVDKGYIQTLNMIGTALTATASAGICTLGAVNLVSITNMGKKYSFRPEIGFSSSPGTTTVGIASLTNEYIQCNGLKGGMVEAIDLVNAGCAYTIAPQVKITPSGNDDGEGATATTGISTNGSIQFVTITDGGSGYTTNPNFTFVGIDTTLPVGVVTGYGYGVINAAGVVTAGYIRYGGENYNLTGLSTITNVNIDDPAGLGSTIGIGTYIFNEVVTGQTSGTSARVNSWDVENHILEIKIVDGSFTSDELVIGETSGACYAMRSQIVDDLVTPYADNDNIEIESNKLFDFTESNPFGDPF